MPELPEVETTRQGIAPYLVGHVIQDIAIHNPNLRWRVPDSIGSLIGKTVQSVDRRGKYLLVKVSDGQAIIHLGMSGSLRIANAQEVKRLHDHIELYLDSGFILRFHDPRRFGCFLWHPVAASPHTLLAHLGPEPLSDDFNTDYLFKKTRKRRGAIKNLIMNSSIVVGVGNIYASESLFMAGVRPGRAASRLTKRDAERLVAAIKKVLQRSINQGGTTLRDFVNSDGNPGYFAQSLNVYGHSNKPCKKCGTLIKSKTIGQRSTFYCPSCQR